MPTIITGETGVNQITDGVITANDLASGSVTSAKLATGAATANLSAGAVLQVVSAASTTRQTTSSTSYVDTALTASITPSSTSNKILVIVSYSLGNTNSSYASWSRLLRDSTEIAQRTYYAGGVGSTYASISANLTILDTPATTSAITYKMQIKSDNASGTTSFNGPETMSYSGGTPTNTSTITLMEIKG